MKRLLRRLRARPAPHLCECCGRRPADRICPSCTRAICVARRDVAMAVRAAEAQLRDQVQQPQRDADAT